MTMETKVLDVKGGVAKTIKLPDDIFNVPMNEHVLHFVVKGYLANKRQGTHATKTKGMVAGGGKKPFKQKGTGEARQGTSRSPLMPGGGVTHGPQPRDYRVDLTKNTRDLALCVALSDKVRHGRLVVVTEFPIAKYSTKAVSGLLKTWKAEKATVSDERKDKFLALSTRNLKDADAITPSQLNAMNVLRREYLVISENALTVLSQRLKGSNNE